MGQKVKSLNRNLRPKANRLFDFDHNRCKIIKLKRRMSSEYHATATPDDEYEKSHSNWKTLMANNTGSQSSAQ